MLIIGEHEPWNSDPDCHQKSWGREHGCNLYRDTTLKFLGFIIRVMLAVRSTVGENIHNIDTEAISTWMVEITH